MFFFFFLEQKTAYELRIGDWISDVCSSDLIGRRHDEAAIARGDAARLPSAIKNAIRLEGQDLGWPGRIGQMVDATRLLAGPYLGAEGMEGFENAVGAGQDIAVRAGRSEEHTSELQSLMRISYAVFCL